jgi:hypothetical protein
MNFFRVHADAAGETHLTPISLPAASDQSGGDKRFGLGDIPTTTLTIGRLAERKFDQGWHTPPRRQVVVVLRGVLEVTTTSGDSQRFQSGDCLLADDLDSKGHITRDVGEDYLETLTIGIPPDWQWPDTP